MDKSRKMEGDYQGQRWTKQFLRQKGNKPLDIHRRLSTVCGETAPARNTAIKRVRNFRVGRQQHTWRVVPWSHPEAPKAMAAIHVLAEEYVELAVV